ncbi:MAG TPA: TraB/GumN family protein [Burkholderiaceae bacterium]|nr:TraB/GumN family protein [Burkholderiaceae bacterium]
MLHTLLWGAFAAHAAEVAANPCTAQSPASAICRYPTGLLWKLERPDRNAAHKPSYLFGTIHVSDPRVINLPAPVRKVFDGARSFTMELVRDDTGTAQLTKTMHFKKDGRTLRDMIGTERYAEVERAFDEYGLTLTDLNRKKPWAVAMLLSVPRQTGIALDLQLQLDAILQRKPVHGLETMQEQLAVFNGLPMNDQIALVDHALRTRQEADAQIEAMLQAYLARDLAGIMTLTDSVGLEDQRLQATIVERLMSRRNLRMFERIRPRLVEGNAFIAVGVAHLSGDNGLLPLLERAGWRVTPIY